MKRGFTFIELIFASSISLVVIAALVTMFWGVMRLVREASDEMQATLAARAARERLYYNALNLDGIVYGGLLTARNVTVSEYGIVADLRFTNAAGNPAWRNAETLSESFTFETDESIGPCRAEIAAERTLYAYLTVERGTGERYRYKDRVVIPLAGQKQGAPTSLDYGPLDDDESYFHVKESAFGGAQ